MVCYEIKKGIHQLVHSKYLNELLMNALCQLVRTGLCTSEQATLAAE